MSKTEKGPDKAVDVCMTRTGGFELRKLLRSVLASPAFEDMLKGLDMPPERVIGPLLCFLYETDEPIRWRAVRGVGIMVAALAEKDLESARIIMRRLIWSLNDESGGIGWGAAEAMGEIMAENGVLAGEYYRILVSYIDEDGNPLGNDALERGVMWAIGRLARKRPGLFRETTRPILAQVNSPDPEKRGLALRALLSLRKGGLEFDLPSSLLRPLTEDHAEIRVFEDGVFEEYKISRLALKLFDQPACP
jgi:hypothetical protein